MIRKLHDMGMSSDVAYIAGFASIGMAVAAWVSSKMFEGQGIDRADRWGIFVGLWAPTFMSMGNALRIEERADTAMGQMAGGVAGKTRESVASTHR